MDQQYQIDSQNREPLFSNNRTFPIIFGITAVVILLVLLILSFLFGFSKNNSTPTNPTPTPVASPTSESTPRITAIPTEYLKQAQDQAQADKKYGDYLNNVNSNYPWYNKLPLQTKDYFVYFNVTKQVFIAKIYTNGNSSIVPFTKSLITKQLTDLGIDLSKYSIDWQVL